MITRLPKLFEPKFVQKLEGTDRHGKLHLTQDHLRVIETLMFVVDRFSQNNPRLIEYEAVFSAAAQKATDG